MAIGYCRLHKSAWLLLMLVILTTAAAAATVLTRIPRLSLRPDGDATIHDNARLTGSTSKDVRTFYYRQTLDHFNYRPESYAIFRQRYLINFKYWGGAKKSAPIFVYLGAEAPIDGDIGAIGFLTDNAGLFNALLVYIEHRYYGKSIPFSSRKEAFKNASTLGYFNSAQAIADYAEIIIHLKKRLRAKNSPVIVIGGSYGGMLASWFRLKYPHVAHGALASSAPILYFDNLTPQEGYYSVVTKDFSEASNSCYETIVKSWSEIDEVAAKPNGLSILSKRFNTCRLLTDAFELKDSLEGMYDSAAQYNDPPKYPVTVVCNAIDKAAFGEDTLSKIYAGMVAYRGNRSCYVNSLTTVSDEAHIGWGWQTCSEMVMPIGRENNTMFQPDPFNLKNFKEGCKESFGVSPRPHWVTDYYGGQDIKLVLSKFGSNIIFSNGLRDPYSSAGVLNNISDTILAVHTVKGSHCLDIVTATESDPDWLVTQRKQEIRIIEGWIKSYHDTQSGSTGRPSSFSKTFLLFILFFYFWIN